ncbi:MAG: hypothetical protein HQL23_05615 [Candidatus Omnitrophica bacterium]|nr:hypothetical protein [Candidatus Omnitrophota bacterium]
MHIDFEPTTNELQIRANQSDLFKIINSLASNKQTLHCPTSELRALFPFSSYLESIQIYHDTNQTVKFSVMDNKYLQIQGSLDKLKILGDNINELIKHPQWQHLHLEYYPDHPYLAKSTLSVVFWIANDTV